MNSSREVILLKFLQDCNLYQRAFVNKKINESELERLIILAVKNTDSQLLQMEGASL